MWTCQAITVAQFHCACKCKDCKNSYPVPPRKCTKGIKAMLDKLVNPKTMCLWLILKYINFCCVHFWAWKGPKVPRGWNTQRCTTQFHFVGLWWCLCCLFNTTKMLCVGTTWRFVFMTVVLHPTTVVRAKEQKHMSNSLFYQLIQMFLLLMLYYVRTAQFELFYINLKGIIVVWFVKKNYCISSVQLSKLLTST